MEAVDSEDMYNCSRLYKSVSNHDVHHAGRRQPINRTRILFLCGSVLFTPGGCSANPQRARTWANVALRTYDDVERSSPIGRSGKLSTFWCLQRAGQ